MTRSESGRGRNCGEEHYSPPATASRAPIRVAVRRQISAIDGRSLELLGHAIEYLADEYSISIGEAGRLESADPRIEAIQLLMALNRLVYYSCPEIEPLYRRFARWLFRIPSAIPAPAPTSDAD
jgi:hypothetical protein